MYVQRVEWNTWIGFIWLSIETNCGCCENGNEHSGPIKCGEFLNQLKNY